MGVSALVSFTEIGRNIVLSLKNVTLIEHPFEVVAEGQMLSNARAKEMKPFVMYLLKRGVSLNSFTFKTIIFLQRVISKLKG